jgi:hypothetical protein
MKTTLITSKSWIEGKRKLLIFISYLLVFSILVSCASFHKLEWEPTGVEPQDNYKIRHQNFELLMRGKHYRILKKDNTTRLVYLKDFHGINLSVIDYSETGKFNKRDRDLTEISVEDIQEIEAKYYPGSSVLLTIGAAGFFIAMIAISGIDFFIPDDDDI